MATNDGGPVHHSESWPFVGTIDGVVGIWNYCRIPNEPKQGDAA